MAVMNEYCYYELCIGLSSRATELKPFCLNCEILSCIVGSSGLINSLPVFSCSTVCKSHLTCSNKSVGVFSSSEEFCQPETASQTRLFLSLAESVLLLGMRAK